MRKHALGPLPAYLAGTSLGEATANFARGFLSEHYLTAKRAIPPERLTKDFIGRLTEAMKVSDPPEGALVRLNAPDSRAYYDLRSRKVHVPVTEHPGGLAHELGHAKLHPRGKLLGALHARMGGLRYVTPAIGAYMAAERDPSTSNVLLASAVGAIGPVQTLWEEAAATGRGLRGLEAVGVSPQVMGQSRRILRRAFATYLPLLGFGIGAPAIVSALRHGEDDGTAPDDV